MSTKRITSGLLAGVIAASMMTVGISASAATLKKPTGFKAANTKTGIKLTWSKVKGAKTYKVYRGKSKKAFATVNSATYTDKKAKAGKAYTYTIKAAKGKKLSSASKKLKVVRLVAPKLSSAKMYKDKNGFPKGLKATWKKSTGAKYYNVYRKATTAKKYSKIAKTKKLYYLDQTSKHNIKYKYMVKAVNGKSLSAASNAKTTIFPDSPEKVTIKLSGTKYTLTWSKVKNASSYTIYDSLSKKVKTVKTTSYTGKITETNPNVIIYTVVTNAAGNKSFGQSSEPKIYIPKNSYYTDAKGYVHVKLSLKKGDIYEGGIYAAAAISANNAKAKYSVNKGTNTSVATVDSSTYLITAKKAGTTTFKVTLDAASVKVLNKVLSDNGFNFKNKLSKKVAYVDVTVK